MSGTIHTWANNPRSQAVLALASIKNVSLKQADFVPGTAPEGFPSFSTAPVFDTENGEKLTQFSAILAHVNGGLNANDVQRVAFAEQVVAPAAAGWAYPTLGAMPNNKNVVAQAKAELLNILETIDNCMSTRTFIDGERASVGDVALFSSLVLAYKQVLAPEYRTKFPHVTRWFNTCANHKNFKSFGKVTLCSKEANFDAKTFGEINKKQAAPKKQAGPKKQAALKKEAAPVETTPAPKKEDPWAGLGGKYDMDAWKRCYSNNDTIPTAMDYFWENLDTENYSCYFGKYKYGDEIGMSFMASNLIRGMYQRLDKMRKHSFGTMCVFGGEEKGDIEISGVFFWKGQDLAFELSEDWKVDYVGYDWQKIDLASEEGKKLVTQYWSWEGFEGKPFVDGKVYK